MKKLTLFTLLLFSSFHLFAQGIDLRRKINVSAHAEKEYTPDVINISISLKEYKKSSREKVDITTLENQLFSAVMNAGLPKSALTIANLSSYNWSANDRKNPDFLVSKQYNLKVPDQNSYNQIIKAIDPKGVSNTYISGTEYSKMEDLRLNLKIDALKQAKAKAQLIAQTLGMVLGKPIEVNDSDSSPIASPVYMRSYAAKSMAETAGEAQLADVAIDFKPLKASTNVSIVFEMQ